MLDTSSAMTPEGLPMRRYRTLSLSDFTTEDVEYVWANIVPGEPDECWEWQGERMPAKEIRPGIVIGGYGRVRISGRKKQASFAHRVVYAHHHQANIPARMVIMHTCDNPPCCNPAHLRLGTFSDNAKDRERKGRRLASSPELHARGNKLLQHRRDEFLFLYNRGMNKSDMARHFNVSRGTIRYLCRVLDLPPRDFVYPSARKYSSHGYRGIYFDPRRETWRAELWHKGVRHRSVCFVKPEEAAWIYDCFRMDCGLMPVNFPDRAVDEKLRVA